MCVGVRDGIGCRVYGEKGLRVYGYDLYFFGVQFWSLREIIWVYKKYISIRDLFFGLFIFEEKHVQNGRLKTARLSHAFVNPKQPIYIAIQDYTLLSSYLTTSGACVYCVCLCSCIYVCVYAPTSSSRACMFLLLLAYLFSLCVCVSCVCTWVFVCLCVLVFPLLSPTHLFPLCVCVTCVCS